ncbi:hypothetical protein [Maribacter arcticus]|jgi:hypothetical protein|uniref:hypothetical protein n=1 Tax=Maribacter arcticus TaxID=561365 RepID=UPI003003095B
MSDKKEKAYNADITKEDLNTLGEKTKNTRTDQGDDQLLNERKNEVDFAGSDLDIPGRNLPKNKPYKSVKDEENQLYSQGGSGNEDLERNTDHIT